MARAVCRCRCVAAGTGSRVGAELAPVPRTGLAPATSPRDVGPVARAARPCRFARHAGAALCAQCRVVNAFATGSKQEASIALTDGLLRSLSPRELAGVFAHGVAHIANEDLRVMGLADSVSRLTCLLALMGQIAILLSLPALLVGAAEVYWPGLLLLAASPQLALLAQLGLSRVREFDADRLAAELTGDPQGLASALAKIERVSRSWRAWLWPGWGNPEPSCLRTRPATQERIARLLTLAPGPASALPLRAPHFFRNPLWRRAHRAGARAGCGADCPSTGDVSWPI